MLGTLRMARWQRTVHLWLENEKSAEKNPLFPCPLNNPVMFHSFPYTETQMPWMSSAVGTVEKGAEGNTPRKLKFYLPTERMFWIKKIILTSIQLLSEIPAH